jgi:hypothetical protein
MKRSIFCATPQSTPELPNALSAKSRSVTSAVSVIRINPVAIYGLFMHARPYSRTRLWYTSGICAGICYIVILNLDDRQSVEGFLYLFLGILIVDQFP